MDGQSGFQQPGLVPGSLAPSLAGAGVHEDPGRAAPVALTPPAHPRAGSPDSKDPEHQDPRHRDSEAAALPRVCARWRQRGGGGGGGELGSEGERFLVRAERGESGSAPRRREELSVCSPLLPPSSLLLLPPSSPSRAVLEAERRRWRAPSSRAAEPRTAAGAEPPRFSASLRVLRATGPRARPIGRQRGPCLTRAKRASLTSR